MAVHRFSAGPTRVKEWQVGITLLAIAYVLVLMLFRGNTLSIGVLVAAWPLFCATRWAAERLDPLVWICAGGVVSAVLFTPASVITKMVTHNVFQPSDSQETFTLMLMIPVALIITSLLIYSVLQSVAAPFSPVSGGNGESRSGPRLSRPMILVALAMTAVLFVTIIYQYYWFIVWDTTGDSLGVLWLFIPTLAILFSAGVLAFLPGHAKLGAAGYLLLVPVLFAVSLRAQAVDFRRLTNAHAEQTSAAIDSFYAREGHYPQNLGQLFPRDALAVPGPVILYGQDWCYDARANYYRLGYVYREHWSDPHLVGRLFKAEGLVPTLPPLCAKEIAALETRYSWFVLR